MGKPKDQRNRRLVTTSFTALPSMIKEMRRYNEVNWSAFIRNRISEKLKELDEKEPKP